MESMVQRKSVTFSDIAASFDFGNGVSVGLISKSLLYDSLSFIFKGTVYPVNRFYFGSRKLSEY
jgi:hypothetical protein